MKKAMSLLMLVSLLTGTQVWAASAYSDFSPVMCPQGRLTPYNLEQSQTQWLNGFVALSSNQYIKNNGVFINTNDVVLSSYSKDMISSDALMDYLRIAVRANDFQVQEDGWSHAMALKQVLESEVIDTVVYSRVILKDDARKRFEVNVRTHYACVNHQVMITQQDFLFENKNWSLK